MSPTKKLINVAIVEDDNGIRQSLEWLLKSSSEFSCVAACRSAEEALQVLPKAAPEVILMDINLPVAFRNRMHRAHQGTAAVGADHHDHRL